MAEFTKAESEDYVFYHLKFGYFEDSFVQSLKQHIHILSNINSIIH